MNKILVIANDSYLNGYESLNGIENEINYIIQIFKKMNYNETIFKNYTYDRLINDITKYISNIESEDTVVIYYTGHGIYFDSHNYIVCTDSIYDIGNVVDASFVECNYKMYDLCNITNVNHKSDKILVVFNGCRQKNNHSFKESEFKCIGLEDQTILPQIYSTSIGAYAYDTQFFYKAFCNAAIRYKHTIADIYESICSEKKELQLNERKSEYQNPVYIKGEKEFYLANIFNYDVEYKMFSDIIQIFNDYILMNNDSNAYALTSSEVYEKFNDISCISRPQSYVINILEKYLLRSSRYGFIGCLMKLPVYSINVKEKIFSIHGKNGWFHFENKELYNYEDCVNFLEKDGKPFIYGVKILSEHIFYINPYETSNEKWFEIRIENTGRKNLKSFFEDEQIYKSMINIINKQCSIMLSASSTTDSIGFLKSLIYKYIAPEEKILFFNYMEIIDTDNDVEHVFIYDIMIDMDKRAYYRAQLEKGKYRWLIISLHASLDVLCTKEQVSQLEDFIETVRHNGISIIYVTNFMPGCLNIMHLTKKFYLISDYEIDLEARDYRENTYVSNFKRIK